MLSNPYSIFKYKTIINFVISRWVKNYPNKVEIYYLTLIGEEDCCTLDLVYLSLILIMNKIMEEENKT